MLFTNNYDLPETVFEAITKDMYDGPVGDPNRISATTIISSPKIRMLRLRHDSEIEEDAMDNVWRLLGSATHVVVQNVSDKDKFLEERIEVQIEGKTVSGQTDVYVPSEETIDDYKVTSAWTVVYSPKGKKEWIEQLNIYAWLFRKQGFKVSKLRIVMILRDWNKSNTFKSADYPSTPIVVLPIELWTEKEQEKFIIERIKEHKKWEEAPDDTIPECTPEERWQAETKYAVYKNANKTASKVEDSMEKANEYIANADQKHKWRVDVREGVDRKCTEYCAVNKFCNYWRENYEQEKKSWKKKSETII